LFGSSQRKSQLDWKQIANVKIFSNWELLVFVIVFLLLSVVLFPKGRLEDIILNGKEYNYELSRIYIERLLKIEFKPELLFSLIEKDMCLGKYKEALHYLKFYEKELYSRKEIKEKAIFYRYLILKAEFFSSKFNSERGKLKEKIKSLLLELAKFSKKETLEKVFKESLSMNLPQVALRVSEQLALLTGEIRWRQEAFRLSLSLSMWEKALQHLLVLMEEDTKSKEKYLKTAMLLAGYLKKKELYEELAAMLINSNKFSQKDIQNIVNPPKVKYQY